MTNDTRTTLLDVAEHVVRARGFDGFSYADLAEAVGIRKASIHYHFPTKAGLSAALLDRYSANIAKLCNDIAECNDKASHRLLGLISLYRSALKDGETLCLCVSLTASHQSLSEEVNAEIIAFRDRMTMWIAEIFALGRQDLSITGISDPTAEARACLALLEGAHLAARAAESPKVFDQAVEVLKARC